MDATGVPVACSPISKIEMEEEEGDERVMYSVRGGVGCGDSGDRSVVLHVELNHQPGGGKGLMMSTSSGDLSPHEPEGLLPVEWEIRLLGYVRLMDKRQNRFYRAEIRCFREDRWSKRKFLRATDAILYGQRWVEGARRAALARRAAIPMEEE